MADWNRAGFRFYICGAGEGSGGAKGIRTPDLHTASVALSQLSYSPTPRIDIRSNVDQTV